MSSFEGEVGRIRKRGKRLSNWGLLLELQFSGVGSRFRKNVSSLDFILRQVRVRLPSISSTQNRGIVSQQLGRNDVFPRRKVVNLLFQLLNFEIGGFDSELDFLWDNG